MNSFKKWLPAAPVSLRGLFARSPRRTVNRRVRRGENRFTLDILVAGFLSVTMALPLKADDVVVTGSPFFAVANSTDPSNTATATGGASLDPITSVDPLFHPDPVNASATTDINDQAGVAAANAYGINGFSGNALNQIGGFGGDAYATASARTVQVASSALLPVSVSAFANGGAAGNGALNPDIFSGQTGSFWAHSAGSATATASGSTYTQIGFDPFRILQAGPSPINLSAIARGGDAGFGGKDASSSNELGDGGNATASGTTEGGGDVFADIEAAGGTGGNAARFNSHAGSGGLAWASANILGGSTAANTVTASISARGGTGGSGFQLDAFSYNQGGLGGQAYILPTTVLGGGGASVNLNATANGGPGGGASGGNGSSGGRGGTASIGTMFASSTTGNVQVVATSYGGYGGRGTNGARGGDGGDETLTDAVSGSTAGTLSLVQRAYAGGAGGTDFGPVNVAGNASSSLTASNPGGGAILATVDAIGGGSGFTQYAAPIAPQGGTAYAAANITGSGAVGVTVTATGGSGDGAQFASDAGSACLGQVRGVSTGGGTVNVDGVVTSGSGGFAAFGPGGRGVDATAVNAVSGATSGSLYLTQNAVAGAGGNTTSGGAKGGDGGNATSILNAVQPGSSLNISVEADGGSAGSGTSATPAHAGWAVAAATGTSAGAVSVSVVARGGRGSNSLPGGSSTADATGSGTSGTVSADALSYIGPNSVVRASTSAGVGSTASVESRVLVGGPLPDMAQVAGLDSVVWVQVPNSAGLINGTAGLNLLFGGKYAADGTGTPHHYTGSIDIDLDPAEFGNFSGRSLQFSVPDAAAAGFESMTLQLALLGTPQSFNQTFASSADADTFFNTTTLGLGGSTTPLELDLSFDLLLDHPGQGFLAELSLPAVPEPSTFIQLGSGLIGLAWWACRRRRCSRSKP